MDSGFGAARRPGMTTGGALPGTAKGNAERAQIITW